MTLGKTPGRISRTLTIVLRAERLIAARRVTVLRRQTGLMVLAGLFVAVAVVMANVAVYQGLATVMPLAWAAAFVALGNIVLAGIMALVAGRMSGERELSSAIEMRDMALEDLEGEIDDLVEEVRGTAREVRRFTRDPLGNILPGLLTPLLNALLAGRGETPKPQPDDPAEPPSAPPPSPPGMEGDFPEDPAAPQA